MNEKTPLQDMLAKLKSVFPDAVTESEQKDNEGKPYTVYALKEEFISQLRDEGLDVTDDQNRYELQFPGKQVAKAQVFAPSYKALVPDTKQSKQFADTGNVFIEGDNLDALRLLQHSYRGKIKMIYIDPPYNTGNDGFVYNDDFSIQQKKYLQATGVLDDEGERQISEIRDGLSGRFHAGWLAMMYPRLKLARELLTENGVIFISIDDNEQANCKLLCDEIFGENNFLSIISWQGMDTIKNDARHFSGNYEYILCYAQNKDLAIVKGLKRTDEHNEVYKNRDNDPRGKYLLTPLHAKSGTENNRLGHIFLNGVKYNPPAGRYWRFSKEKLKNLELDNRIYFPKKSEGTPQNKTFLSEVSDRINVTTFWAAKFAGSTRQSNKELSDLLGKGVFQNSKPVSLIKIILEIIMENDDIILDFFAGSATTAHAAMQLNAEDGGDRKFIMVQIPEKINANHSKEAHTFCTDLLNRPATIAEISKERIRRAGEKIITENPEAKIDTGFRVFTIDDSLLTHREQDRLDQTGQAELTNYQRELAVENFTPLLYEALVKTGLTLDWPIAEHKIGEYPYAICARRCYCVSENLTQDIVAEIMKKYSNDLDILYYLSDCPTIETSYTELEGVVRSVSTDIGIQSLGFY